MLKASQAGSAHTAKQFDGTVYRSLKTEHEQGAPGHHQDQGSVGRYNAASESLIYTSPSRSAAIPEARPQNQGATRWAYSLVSMDFNMTTDAQGRHGVCRPGRRRTPDEAAGGRALTYPQGQQAPSLLYQLAGEHPYSLGQQAAEGCRRRGQCYSRPFSHRGATDRLSFPATPTHHPIGAAHRQAFAGKLRCTQFRNAEGLVKPMRFHILSE